MTNKASQPVTKEFENAAIRKMSAIGIGGNLLLTAFKLSAGVLGHSGAMVSDAVHSLSDVFATLIAYIGVKISKRGDDTAHPYGHERFESVASLLLGLLLLGTGIIIGKNGVATIISGNYTSLEIPSAIALIAAIVSIASKEGMFWYTRHYAKLLNSPAFMADAWHHRSDAFSSIGSLIGIGGAMLGYPIMDCVAAVIICLFILKTACDILLSAFREMLDTSMGETFEAELRALIQKDARIRSIDMLHTRMFGSKVYVDLEISVDGDKSLADAHTVAEELHDSIEHSFPSVKHVMIHINPAE